MRIVWLAITGVSVNDIAKALNVSSCTIYRYVELFHDHADVVPESCTNGPERYVGAHEIVVLLRKKIG